MRSATEIKNLIIDFAVNDNRVRTVLLNGSRANAAIQPDEFQDYDVVFIVTHLDSFISDHNWTNIFGDKLTWQLPDEMVFGNDPNPDDKPAAFAYLMLFDDGNRIDLTLFPLEAFATGFIYDSLTVVWLDKDNLFPTPLPPGDKDYHIKKPTEKYFRDACNEFWWVSTYVAKGLVRNEITYAKEMMETVVRPMFMKMLAWKIGNDNNFSVSFGKGGKLMHLYLSKEVYTKVLQTYADADVENNWQALFVMTELFKQFSTELSSAFKYQQNTTEQENTTSYLLQLYQNPGCH